MIAYNLIYDNTSVYYGGGILVYQCTPDITNNTITQNQCTSTSIAAKGGGLYAAAGGYVGRNNIIYDNIATTYPECYGTVDVTYTCCSTGLTGTGNITDDPEFEDPSENDFNLEWGSPCINGGDPSSPLDPDGTTADMGALYFHMGPGFEERPDEPTNFTVSHNNADLIATLDWTNPSLNAGGNTLAELTGVKIYREEQLIDDVTDVSIGQPYNYDDTTVPAAGMYEYEIVPYNSYGDGISADASAWIGLDSPAEPSAVVATPDPSFELECTVDWTAPSEGEHGGYFPAGSWTGQRVYRDGIMISELPGTNTSHVDVTVPEYGWYVYGVSYYNSTGEGPIANADPIYVGPPQFALIPYEWVEISQTGTHTGITTDDGYAGPFNIGFEFPFYDEIEYRNIYVCANGWTSLSSIGYGAFTNYPLPDPATPNNLICPFWDDLNPSQGGGIYYLYDQPNDRFIIEWLNVPHYSTGGSYSFEMILYPNGDMDFMYMELTPGTANSATVGVENDTGTEGTQVTYNGSGPLEPAVQMGIRVFYVEQIVGVEEEEIVLPDALPLEFALNQAYPNPFNPSTTIGYALPKAARVTLTIYDISGRQVARVIDGWRDAGWHDVSFDATDLSSGVYIYRMQAAHFNATGKMVLMK